MNQYFPYVLSILIKLLGPPVIILNENKNIPNKIILLKFLNLLGIELTIMELKI